ncbi:MAG: hypothetical protein VX023_03580, partial [Candidatus Thermoplasmatota archaeon]|nr:hypothetical protein [Candidatus Thermoplasmatota archaeon]
LEFDGEPPKKVLKKIARVLDEDGMNNVKLITNSRVPIVKFQDAQSMIPVDISVNNNLSVYNTELLRRYCEIDERVKPFILAIKYWARSRGVCDPTSGSFSSYAWTLIAINALQNLDSPILPNLSKQDKSRLAKINGISYDVSIKTMDQVNFVSKNKSNLAELIIGFFSNIVENWPWNKSVISVREGGLIPRKTKGWLPKKPYASELIRNGQTARLGKHSLPVEDPFDELHDLSVVLDADGVFETRDELLRIKYLLTESVDWSTICEPKYPDKAIGEPQLDLFEDLRTKPDSEVRENLQTLYGELAEIDRKVTVRESERNDAIRMSKALRRNAELAKEQSALATELRPRRSKIDEAQSKRDSSNNNYIPVHFIEDELRKVYYNLTEQSQTDFELSFDKEKSLFSWFFELQSMHEHAKRTRQYHREFLRLVNQQEKSVEQIKDIRQEIIDVNSLGKFTDFDELAKRLLIELNPLKKERRMLRREIGRLEAWLRKKTNKNSENRRYRKTRSRAKKSHGNVDQLRGKVASGDSFSLQDLDVLLKNGGINSVSQNESPHKKSTRRNKKNQASLQPHRGKRGKSSKSN